MYSYINDNIDDNVNQDKRSRNLFQWNILKEGFRINMTDRVKKLLNLVTNKI